MNVDSEKWFAPLSQEELRALYEQVAQLQLSDESNDQLVARILIDNHDLDEVEIEYIKRVMGK